MSENHSDSVSLQCFSKNNKYNMELSELFNKMLLVDESPIKEPDDYKINIFLNKEIFLNFNFKKLFNNITYSIFYLLINKEEETNLSKPNIYKLSDIDLKIQFIKSIMSTEVFLLTLNFLKAKGIISSSDELGGILYTTWFSHNSRISNELKSTCSFDKIFRNRIKEEKVINNWMIFLIAETTKLLKNIEKHKDIIIYKDKAFLISTVQNIIETDSEIKSSFLVGVSPEFELLIYTVISLLYGSAPQKIMIEGELMIEIFVDTSLGDIKEVLVK